MKTALLLFGSNGQLGQEFQRFLKDADVPVLAFDRHNTDIADKRRIRESLNSAMAETGKSPSDFSAILNCAAYTDVEKAEDDPTTCDAVNVTGAKNLSELAMEWDIPIIYYSTDFVFDGKKGSAYEEGDSVNPLSRYGHSKLNGEWETRRATSKHFILRVAWLYGQSGNHFIKKVISQAKVKNELRIVDDQFGSPTWTHDVVLQTMKILEKGEFGTYHTVNTGLASRKELAEECIRLKGLTCKVSGCKTHEFPMKAERPMRADLKNSHLVRLGINVMQDWKSALQQYISSDPSL